MEQQLLQQIASAGVDLSEVEIDHQFNEECLEAHNRYRSLHGCPPLKLSEALAANAQNWANNLANLGYLKHSPNAAGNFGENVAMKMSLGSTEYKGAQATAQWYSEIEFYEFDGPENQSRCGHFSQVVWKGTKEAGFGKAIAPDGKMFAVGQYTPAGNFMNKWRENIPAPLSGTIAVPSREEIMGEQPQQQPMKTVTKRSAKGGIHTESLESIDGPDPHDPQDRQVGKATKTRIVNGEKTVTVTVTFMRPDGSRYQVSKETVTPREFDDSIQMRSSLNGDSFVQVTRQRRNFAAPPAEEDEEVVKNFKDEMVQLHNGFRELHGAPPLRRSDSLDKLANDWARSLCQNGALSHCRDANYGKRGLLGQNIAKKPADLPKSLDGLSEAEQLCHQWYAEENRFRFGAKQPDDICGGHFSQMVWRNSEVVGVGRALDSATGDVYVACFYHPCGNVEGQFDENVQPSLHQ